MMDERNVTKADPQMGRPSCGSLHGPRWYVAESEPRKIRVATYELLQKGFHAFLPTQTVRRRLTVGGHRQSTYSDIQVPMFYRFLFVRFDVDHDDWRAARYADGVQRLLMSASQRPVAVERGLVERLIETAPERLKLPAEGMSRLTMGAYAKVMNEDHWMAGHRVQVVTCDGRTTIVRGQMFGRQIDMTLLRADLVAE